VKYVVFVPKDYTGDKEFPVILFLHGAGESGTDGLKQVGTGLGKAIRDKKGDFGFIAVFPQSQKGGWKAESAEGKRAVAILDEVLKTYKTDPKRVYLAGPPLPRSAAAVTPRMPTRSRTSPAGPSAATRITPSSSRTTAP
jgi:predicted peptidase